MVDFFRLFAFFSIAALLSACASQPPAKSDYSALRSQQPRSILVVPAVNRSVDVTAADYLLTTVTRPLAERGYYVFPVHMTRQLLEDDGLGDADLVHDSDPARLGKMFGADAILYIGIERWDARYLVLQTTVTVDLRYTLKSASTGQVLWENRQSVVHQPDNRGNQGLAGLLVQAVVAAVQKAAPNYMPLARRANQQAVYTAGRGLPAGPYDAQYNKDGAAF
jgi:hypothetical protein